MRFLAVSRKTVKKTTIVSSAICVNLQKNGKSIDISRKPCYNKEQSDGKKWVNWKDTNAFSHEKCGKMEEFRTKMKKMLAILAALSVLGTTGLTVGAEDAATTEPATEAITTTEPTEETTEAETTAVEEETTEETVAAEENQVVGMEDASADISISGVAFTVKVSVAADNSVVLSVLKGGVETNLSNICVESRVTGELQVNDYYSVNDLNGLVIHAVDGNHIYTWDEAYNGFTACSLNEDGEEKDTKINDASTFQMNGKTVKVVLFGYANDKDELLRLSVYVDGKLTNLSGIVVNSNLQGIQGSVNYTDEIVYQYSARQYFSVSGNVLTIKPRSGYGTTASYTLDAATNTFVASTAPTTTATTTDSTTTTTTTIDPAETEEALRKIFEEYVDEKKKELPYTTAIDSFYYDESAKKAYGIYTCEDSAYLSVLCIITKDGVVEQSNITYKKDAHRFEEAVCFTCNGSTFIAAIVNLSSNGGNLYALNIYNVSGNEPTRTNLYTIYVGNVISPYGYEITDPDSSIALDDYFTVKSDSVITVKGVDYTYDTESGQFVKVGSDSGKTDNGSASNAPASTVIKNTSGTPKTGDVTTVPAVAVGLTLTAAGVVAFISKRKKK